MALSNIYLCRYNNYFNRIIKRHSMNPSDLQPITVKYIESVNFNRNDGVETKLIINFDIDTLTSNNSIDYLIEYSPDDYSVTNWFIMEAKRNLKGQYELSLRRDVLADNYDNIVQSPCLIEKATLDEDDPFIYNSEGQRYNQIKKKETLLKDFSGCPWIIGYMPRTFGDSATEVSINIPSTVETAATYASWDNFPYHNYVSTISTTKYKYKLKRLIALKMTLLGTTNEGNKTYMYIFDMNTKYREDIPILSQLDDNYSRISKGIYVRSVVDNSVPKVLSTGSKAIDAMRLANSIINLLNTSYLDTSYDTLASVKYNDELIEFNNINIKVANQVYNLSYEQDNASLDIINDFGETNFISNIQSMFNGFFRTGNFDEDSVDIMYYYSPLSLRANYITDNLSTTIPAKAIRVHCETSQFDMFCMPFNKFKEFQYKKLNENPILSLPEDNLNIANAIMTQLGNVSKDIQLIPFCPIPEQAFDLQAQTTTLIVNNTNYTEIKQEVSGSEIVVGYIFWLNRDSFQRKLICNVTSNKTIKEQCELDMYRLCSPGFTSQFEFNAAKNGGIHSFNAEVTLKPYTPYVKVNPNFGGLYGQNFGDKRGLIMGDDFSLPIENSAWVDYELRNKNYQNIFDRNIKSLELQQGIAKTQDIFSAVTGTVSGGINGAFGGAQVGGVYGAIAGAVIGTAVAGVGGAMDVSNNRKLRADMINKSVQMFNYSLENIQALPYTITKSTPLDINNKYFPVLEYYTCTDEELEAFRAKIQWTGMTVNRVGTIQEFIRNTQTYIKAIPLRLNIVDDFHMATVIADEMQQGFYVGGN